jgi:hypothetical protein
MMPDGEECIHTTAGGRTPSRSATFRRCALSDLYAVFRPARAGTG